jgi:hypothetical protein
MANQRLFYCKFIPTREITISELTDFLSAPINDSEDKFIIKETSQNIIDCYLLTFFISKELTYDEAINDFTLNNVKRNLITFFSIDLANQIMEIWGSRSGATKVMTALSIALDNKIIMETITPSFPDIRKRLIELKVPIGKIKVDNMMIENDIVASCTFDLSTQSKPYSVVDKYKDNIVQITGSFKEDDQILSFTVYNSGSVILHKSREQLTERQFDFIRKLCFGIER